MKKGSKKVGRYFVISDEWVFGKNGIVSCWKTSTGFVVSYHVNPGDEDGSRKFRTESEARTFAGCELYKL